MGFLIGGLLFLLCLLELLAHSFDSFHDTRVLPLFFRHFQNGENVGKEIPFRRRLNLHARDAFRL